MPRRSSSAVILSRAWGGGNSVRLWGFSPQPRPDQGVEREAAGAGEDQREEREEVEQSRFLGAARSTHRPWVVSMDYERRDAHREGDRRRRKAGPQPEHDEARA